MNVLAKYIGKNGEYLNKIVKLSADINPTEIASHIEDGTLGSWCKSWQNEVELVVDSMKNEMLQLVIGVIKDDG